MLKAARDPLGAREARLGGRGLGRSLGGAGPAAGHRPHPRPHHRAGEGLWGRRPGERVPHAPHGPGRDGGLHRQRHGPARAPAGARAAGGQQSQGRPGGPSGRRLLREGRAAAAPLLSYGLDPSS